MNYPMFSGSFSILQVINQIVLALIASTIFYFIVVYFPKKKANQIAKDFVIETYKRTKISIIEKLIWHNKRNVDYERINENYLNYVAIRKYINHEDIEKFRNYGDPETFRNLNIEILFEYDILKHSLINTLSHNFIKQNQNAYEKINYIIQWIDQFHHEFNNFFHRNDDFDYSKSFCSFINEAIRGISIISGPKSADDFNEIIEYSFKSSLLFYKLRKILPTYLTAYRNWR